MREDRVEQFLGDILAGPEELAAVVALQLSALEALPSEVVLRPRRRLVGMGSSGFAARDAAARWRRTGRDAVAEVASASGGSPGGRDTLTVVISSSGGTSEAVAAASRHRAAGSFVLGLTSRPDSRLAGVVDAVIPLCAARVEASGIASLSHRATVAALLRLDDDPAVNRAIEHAPAALAALLHSRDRWVTDAASLLDTGREVHVLGDGACVGLVEQAALMLREAPRITALPWDTGDWLHVGLYTLLPGDAVLLLAGSPSDSDAIDTVHARGGRVVVVGPEQGGADFWIPSPGLGPDWAAAGALAVSVVPELLAAELWRRASS